MTEYNALVAEFKNLTQEQGSCAAPVAAAEVAVIKRSAPDVLFAFPKVAEKGVVIVRSRICD